MSSRPTANSEMFRSLQVQRADDLPSESLEIIEAICNQFESEWQSGQVPSVETHLQQVREDLRTPLLIELLLLDIDYRTRDGQVPVRSDYDTRFPNETPALDNVFRAKPTVAAGLRQAMDYVPATQRLSVDSQYRLEKFHARGGLGTVYVGRDQVLGREVAIKFSRRFAPSDAEQSRLEREAAITGRLEHPGIVPVYATGTMENGTPCYVMQLIAGQTLQEAILEFHSQQGSAPEKFKSLRFRQLLQRIIAVCNTVAYAHDQGVIHRDIKPNNIMLGRFGETFLLDWGLAKRVDESSGEAPAWNEVRTPTEFEKGSTRPGQPIGTPAYASPEQVFGEIERQDSRSDVYSLGATLYFLLVGSEPPVHANPGVKPNSGFNRSAPSPQSADHSVPRPLDAICRKSMAADPGDRYPTATAVATELEKHLADESISVHRDSVLTSCRRWLRKHPRISATMVSTLLVTLLGLGIGYYLLGNKNTQLQMSNQNLAQAQRAQNTANMQTLVALRSLTDGVIERSLSHNPTLLAEDREFMQNVIERYRLLADLQLESDKAEEVKLEGLYRVGQLNKYVGQGQEALRMWNEGLALGGDPVAAHSPGKCEITARIHNRVGLLLADLGQSGEAVEHAEKGVKLFEDLDAAFPHNPDYTIGLARAYSELGVVRQYAEDNKEAARAFEKSLALTIPLQRLKPGDRFLNQQIATDLSNLGSTYRQLGEYDRAAEKFKPAIAGYQALIRAYPTAHMYQLNLARSYLGSATLQRLRKDNAAAKRDCEKSIEISQSLHESFPLVPDYLFQLGSAYHQLGVSLSSEGKIDDAFEKFDVALNHIREAIKKTDGKFRYRQELIKVLHYCCQQKNKHHRFDSMDELVEEGIQTARIQIKESRRFRTQYNLARALINQGSIHMRNQEYEQVLELYSQASEQLAGLESDRRWPQTLQMRTVIHRALGNGHLQLDQMEQAAQHWQRAFQLSGSRDPALGVLSAYCSAHVNPDDAMRRIEAAAELDGLKPPQVFNLACAAAVCTKRLTGKAREDALNQMYRFLDDARGNHYFQDRAKFVAFRSNPSFDHLQESSRLAAFQSGIEQELNAGNED